MDSEVVRSFSPARDERWRKKLQRGQKKATPQFGSENWQKLRLPTSQVYTLENANSNFLSKISYQNRPSSRSESTTVNRSQPQSTLKWTTVVNRMLIVNTAVMLA